MQDRVVNEHAHVNCPTPEKHLENHKMEKEFEYGVFNNKDAVFTVTKMQVTFFCLMLKPWE